MVADYVNGKTSVYGVIGSPIEHTFSPQIHNTCANIMKLNIAYCPFHVPEGSLEDAVKGAYALGIKGLNVTVPHKIDVMKYLCGVDERAEHINAVNTLKYTENGYFGYNTDIIGMYYALKEEGVDIKGKNVLLLGAGGAGCAGAVMAVSNEAQSLTIANRTVEKAQRLKEHIGKYYNCPVSVLSVNDLNGSEKYDIIINTTTVGFGTQAGLSPVDKAVIKNAQVVFDAIYTPWETKLLKDAGELSVKAVNGFDMLVYQAIAAEEIWLDIKFDSEKKKEIKEELAKYYKEKR